MRPEIFISYRRVEAKDSAQLLQHRLSDWFGADAIFLDRKDLNPGEDFSAAIQTAIGKARVTLALIGPDWLKEINRRSRLTDGSRDVVRLELRMALERQKADASAHRVIPVLVNNGSMPAAQQFEDAGVRSELEALCAGHAAELIGDVPTWNHGLWKLASRLVRELAISPLPDKDDAARIDRFAKAVRGQLAAPLMRPLADAWQTDDPLASFDPARLKELIKSFYQAIKGAQPVWLSRNLSTDQLAAVKRHAGEIAARIALLAVDGAAARRWLDGGHAAVLPLETCEALALVCALHRARVQPLSLQPRRINRFGADGAVDMAGLDNGPAQRREAALERELNIAAMPPEARFSIGEGQRLSAVQIDSLKTAISSLMFLEDRQFLVTDAVPDGGGPPDYLLKLAASYGIDAQARTGKKDGEADALLRGITESELNSLMYHCLDQIERIK